MSSTPNEVTEELCNLQPVVNLCTNARVSGKFLYEYGPLVAPAWHQLGDVTRSVWEEKARRYNEGDPRWWSCQPQEKT